MSDLVEQLRNSCYLAFDDGANDYASAHKAADRIEELQADLEEAIQTAERAGGLLNRMDEARLAAEAKRERAVYAMEVWLQAQEPDIDIAIKLMHDTLSELKGQTDE